MQTQVVLVRHGETAWSISGQHTGRSDIPLTDRGEREALSLGARLRDEHFARVLTSPLLRARRTAELAGFGAVAVVEPDLAEWGYGQYEGRRTAEIHQLRPGWELFRDGCPGGEALAEVAARADRVIGDVRAQTGDVLLFAHQDILRILAARWLGLPALAARHFLLATGSLSVVGDDLGPDLPVMLHWNDDRHLAGGSNPTEGRSPERGSTT